MPADSIRGSAARTATLVAVPVAIIVLLVSALAFGGFGRESPAPAATGPVALPARDLPPETAATCQLLISKLPSTVAGHAQRPVTEGAEQNAAYGDPPITLECGTSQPTVPDTDQVFHLAPPGASGGVCWYPIEEATRTVYTTVDREIPVTVTVPGPSEGSAQSVVPFTKAIGENVPLRDVERIPTGCSSEPVTR